MKGSAPSTTQEELRLKALYSYDVLGEGLEEELTNLIKLAAFIANAAYSCLTFLDKDTITNKVSYGIIADENVFPRESSISDFLISSNSSSFLIIEDLKNNPKLSSCPILRFLPETTACFCFPVIDAEGYTLGFLFIADNEAKTINTDQISALQTLVNQIVNNLILRRKNKIIAAQTKSYEEFVNVFEASPEIHSILDRSGEILFLNKAAFGIFGYKIDEVINKKIWDFCHEEDRSKLLHKLEIGLQQGKKHFSVDFRMIGKSGQLKWLSWNLVSKGNRWYCYGRDITEKKHIDAQLNNLSFVASKVNNAVVISDGNNRVGWVNEAFTKITGYTLKDVQGRPLGDLISGPETDWSMIEKARLATNNKESFTVEILAYRKDGEKIWLSIHSTVIIGADGDVETEIEIIIDITEKKKAEEQLFILSTVASKTNNGVLLLDKNWEITWTNKALDAIVGYQQEEILGKKPFEIFATNKADFSVQRQSKESFYVELEIEKKDKTQVWLSVSNTPIFDRDGEIERFIEIISDITDRKKFETNIINAKEQALQLSSAKEMFLSVMSHELRTPLNAVIGMTHILLDNDPKPSQIDDLNILKFSGENLLRIINDVLDFSKIETGNLELEFIPVQLKVLCTDIINSFKVEADKRDNELVLSYDSNIPTEVLVDKTRLYQILMNLLGNALKFTKKGRVTLIVDLLKSNMDNVELLFQVKDSGIGIPKDKHEYIFDSFTQAKPDTARKYGGTGLGLAITKKLVQLFGSTIKLDSEEGKGANFYFQLNLQPHDKAIEKKPKTISFGGKRILIVDDNQVNIMIAERILKKWDLNIDHVLDGYQAIEKIQEYHYDLIFMDIHMPGMDGYETTTLIRGSAKKHLQKVPIIALTASTLDKHFYKFKECGMNGYVLKPFNPSEIKRVLVEHLK